MTFPALKVTYFDMAGRAETVRLALTIGGVPFEDQRLQREQWAALKPSLPFRQLPALTVDGHVLCQSHAIARYAGSLAGLYPTENRLDACRVDEITDFCEDFMQKATPSFREADPAKKKAMRVELASTTFPEMFALLEARVASSGSKGPWFLDAISIADLDVYCMVSMMKSGFMDDIPTTICDHYTKIMTIHNAVAAHPKVAAWNEAHKK
ncbi:hypothetical protein H257_10285 [Aphanomyces astaci]|uniref:Glutathione S-transferase n=1 Tax=Aphanomyces astaci TaxID=112090 RepID=W4G913_APHAT|nr:hypothetical protein H257_10285 [Aphanomyces astaci]ETV75443.1 hypothetical protein H257_10285 [Aphanomyces astaci]RHZ38493.1 hypothetical protein DYB31_005243 [Aphanomyces astaci]|eukprot:XP_009835077.1 hypothetical protein H257_10285 [Aphanomyces astaci]